MKKKTKKDKVQEADAEYEGMSKKEALAQFDEAKQVYVFPRKLASKPISIRLPMTMIQRLREAALRKGDIGYQQMIKIYISEGLDREFRNNARMSG